MTQLIKNVFLYRKIYIKIIPLKIESNCIILSKKK